MSSRTPQVGDIWCFYGLGKNFYYLIAEYIECDPKFYDADTVKMIGLTHGDAPLSKEGVSKIAADNRRWKFIA